MPESSKNSAKPQFPESTVGNFLENFGIRSGEIEVIKQLVSYDDQNFYIKLSNGHEHLFKITNSNDSKNVQLITEVTLLMAQLAKSIPCSVPKQILGGGYLSRVHDDRGGTRREFIARLFDFLPGKTLENSATLAQAYQWGELLGRMHVAFLDMDFPSIKSRSFLWDWEHVTDARKFLDVHTDGLNKRSIEEAFDAYDRISVDLKKMKRELLHGDLNERNVLVNSSGEVYAVLDFGDCQGGPFIWDVALVIAYVCLALEDVKRDLLEYTGQALAGYCQHMPQIIQEHGSIRALRTLVCARFAQSLTLGLHSFRTSGDPYVLTSQKNGWPSLHMFQEEPEERFREVWQGAVAPDSVTLK
ncbi:hydroxylysine kinase [Galendromus occidentalis]|uniref:Hydroxylysine kinase n=1 Tax=Galendromus occidentalis TaxID=34638 RepID=A0AAJ7L5G2_9ACAR|nr:hydroxylysine kinase [Galendromus occidentalis]